MTPAARLDWTTKERMPGRPRRVDALPGREPPQRGDPDEGDDGRRDGLRDDDGDERRGHPARRKRDDRDEAEPRRAGLVHAAEVIPAVQEERRRADVLRRLHEREQGRGEDGALHAGLPEDPVRERCERDEDHRRESAADELQNEHLPEQPPQTAPVPGSDGKASTAVSR